MFRRSQTPFVILHAFETYSHLSCPSPVAFKHTVKLVCILRFVSRKVTNDWWKKHFYQPCSAQLSPSFCWSYYLMTNRQPRLTSEKYTHTHTHWNMYWNNFFSEFIYANVNPDGRHLSPVISGSKQIMGLWKTQFYVESTSTLSAGRNKNKRQLDLAGVSYVRMCFHLSIITCAPIKSLYICCAACKNIMQTHIYLKISPYAHQCWTCAMTC